MRTTTIEVIRGGAESSTSLLRRFQKRVQGSGVLPYVRSKRYKLRATAKFARKKNALKRIERREKYQELLKLGKITETKVRRRR